METIKTLSETFEPFIIERRRFYHAHPEFSGEEIKTTESIAADLEKMGITPRFFHSCQGLYADIRGAKDGPIFALRADIDALAIREETGLPFASTNGAMHACGHDCHIAMQLGAARILREIRDELCGTVRLIFQPAEETGSGSLKPIAEGVLEGVKAIYAAHIWGSLDAPLIDVTPGSRMSAMDRFTITIKGKASHGSAPHLGADALTAACSLVTDLQMIPSRFNNPLEPMVLTIGTIEGGTAYNILADRVTMRGAIRHFRSDSRIKELMERMTRAKTEAMGCGYEFDYQSITYPIRNDDPMLNRIAREAICAFYGETSVGNLPVMMSSEDYSHYLQKIPGILAFIGSRNETLGLTATNHENTYTVDESVLKRGAAVAAAVAFEYNQRQKDQ